MVSLRDGETTGDLSPLAWVQEELRRALEAAHKAVRRFLREAEAAQGADIAAVDPSVLNAARQQVHQAVGALRMVGEPAGAAMVLAAEAAVQRLIARPQNPPAGFAETFEKASFALLEYLGRRLSGRPLSPIAMFPQYRALQALAGTERVHPADLWHLDWAWRDLPVEAGIEPRAVDADSRSELESGLLSLMRPSQGQGATATQLSALFAGLGAGATDPQHATLWRLAAGLYDAQAHELLRADNYSKRIGARLLSQLRAIEQGREPQDAERLAKELLFFCAQADSPGDGRQASRLAEVRQVFDLATHEPVDYEQSRLGRFDPAWISQARKRVAAAKDAWSSVAGGELHRLSGLGEQFALVGESLRKLYAEGEGLADELSHAVAQTVQQGAAPEPALAMEIATGVLYLEASLEDGELDHPQLAPRIRRLAERIAGVRAGRPPEPLEPWMEELYRRVSDRQTMGSVVEELRSALGEAERQIDQYFRDPTDRAALIPVPGQLSTMRGVLSVLGFDQAATAVQRMRGEVDELVGTELDPARARYGAIFERLAGNLGALGFLIDMLGVQPQVAKSLFSFDAETGVFAPLMGRSTQPTWTGSELPGVVMPPEPRLVEQAQALAVHASREDVPAEDVVRELDRLAQAEGVAEQPLLAASVAQARQALGQAGSEDESAAAREQLAQSIHAFVVSTSEPIGLDVLPVPVTPAVPSSGLEEDDEMREVFLEEAREVIASAVEALDALHEHPDDIAQLTTVRRAFHTLKGSSRMVGLSDFGEAAWACEQLYNARLAETPRADDDLLVLSTQALAYLQSWVDGITAGGELPHRSTPLRDAADALRLRGERLALPLPGTAPEPWAEQTLPVDLMPGLDLDLELPELQAAAPSDAPIERVSLAGLDEAPIEGPVFEALTEEPGTVPAMEAGAASRASEPLSGLNPDSLRSLDLPSVDFTLDLSTPDPAAAVPAPTDGAPFDLDLGLSSTPGDGAEAWNTAPAQPDTGRAGPTEPTPAWAAAPESAFPGLVLPSASDLDLSPDAGVVEPLPSLEAGAGLPSGWAALPEVTDLQAPNVDGAGFDVSSGPVDPAPFPSPFEAPVSEVPYQGADAPAPAEPDGWQPATGFAVPESAAGPTWDGAVIEPPAVGEASTFLPDAAPEEDPVPSADLLAVPGFAAPRFEPEPALVPPQDMSFAEEEPYKQVGPLRLTIPLFNIYLNEADELSRRLTAELGEWSLECDRPVSEDTIALAHSLAGSSATVGFAELSSLARSLEHALTRVRAIGSGTTQDAALFNEVAEDIRRLLTQFAAGFLQSPQPDLIERLAEHERVWGAQLEALGENALHGYPAEPESTDDAVGLATDPDDVAPELPPQVPLGQTGLRPLADLPAPAAMPAPLRDRVDAGDDDIDAVDAVDADLFPIFEEEALELLPQLASRLQDWAQAPGHAGGPAACMRTLHTLKGGARLAGAMRLGEQAHRLESAIELLAAQEGVTTPEVEALQSRADALVEGLEALRRSAAAAAGESAEAAERPSTTAAPWSEASSLGELPESAFVPAAPETAFGATPDALPAAASPGPGKDDIDWSRFIGSGPAEPRPVERAQPAVALSTVRVRAPLLDRLVNHAGEVSITRSRIEVEVAQLRSSLTDLTDNLERLRGQLRDIELQAETQMASRMEAAKAASESFDPLEFDRFTRFQELTRMMAESVNDVATVQRTLQRTLEATEDDLAAQSRLTRELQDDLLRTRMVEFESIADRLYRVVRQAAKETGKQVRLDIVGGSTEVDRGVLDRMTGAFEHLLRNAVTHGVELPEARGAAGKDATGTIVVSLTHEGNEVGVDFRDDGRGLDLDRIRARAQELALLDGQPSASDADLVNLIFNPGFSTASSVTELAGRGVGMDVVRSEVHAMGGRIETATTAGQGTSFRLVLPLTTAVTQVVLLRCGDNSIAVPATLVEMLHREAAEPIERAYETGSYEHDGAVLPFFYLGALLELGVRGPDTGRHQPVVVVRSAQQRIALHVDEVLGNQEAVVKNLGPQLSRMPGLAGMTLLADGTPTLIYNPVALATLYGQQARGALLAQRRQPDAVAPASEPVAERQAPLVLVVDDSLTVRRVTQRLLLREGYRVALAKDGLDALERLSEQRPDVVLSDIEMPRMDGFDLVRNMRGDDRWRDLPVIMITSRIAQKHRDHATSLGVDHYLGKPYSEEDLLALIRSHVGAESVLG